MFNLIRIIFYQKKIAYINSSFQYINILEYLYKFQKKSLKTFVVISDFSKWENSNKKIIILNIINEFLNVKDIQIIQIKNSFERSMIIQLLKFKKFLNNKINLYLMGNYDSYLAIMFFEASKKCIIVDDGTNSLNFKKNFKKKLKKNLMIFSIFEKKVFQIKNHISNTYEICKKFLKKKREIIKKILICGNASVEKNILLFDEYLNALKTTRKLFKNSEIFYFPHPKENKSNIYKIKRELKFNLIQVSLPVEIYLLKNNFKYKKIISYTSTSSLSLCIILGNSIKILSLFIKFKNKKKINNENFHYKIYRYFKNKKIIVKKIFI